MLLGMKQLWWLYSCAPFFALPIDEQAQYSQTKKPSDDVVRIGILTDLSGPYSDYTGKGSVEAVRMAVEDFGGKVAGKRIDIVIADHWNNPDTASAKAYEWFGEGGVDMILDLVGSPIAL